MWLEIHPVASIQIHSTCIRCETYTFHYFSTPPNKDQSHSTVVPNPRIPGSQDPRIPEEATKKGPLSRHQQDASLCGGHGVLRCGLARSFGLLFRRGWEVLGCPAGQVLMGKVQPAQQPWETPAIEKNNQWLWHIGTLRVASFVQILGSRKENQSSLLTDFLLITIVR